MSHYDPNEHTTELRCDGNHEWGKPYLDKSSLSTVFEDGEICIRVDWLVLRGCTNEYTNNVKSAYKTCRKTTVVDRGADYIPVREVDA